MSDSYRLRSTIAVVALVLSVIWVLPNFVNVQDISWWPSKSKINYGLDIQGGLHLVMGADVEGVVRESVTRLTASLTEELKSEGARVREFKTPRAGQGEFEMVLETQDMKPVVKKLIADRYAAMLQVMDEDNASLTIRYYDAYLTDYKDKVIQQSIETIRNRIDEFGVAEPSISRQGEGRILVQLPGMADAERAKELINTTARLDFMIVSRDMDQAALQKLITDTETAGGYSLGTLKYSDYVTRLNQDLQGKLPANTVVYFEKSQNAQKLDASSAIPYLLRTDSNLGGKDLDNAFVNYGQYGEPEVALRFNAAGANRFADLTGSNIGQNMAIVLDRVVKSAPNIRDRIGGGNAVITLGGRNRDQSMDEAKMISTALRAGALPASLEQLEERRIGPSLGSDSIEKAKLGSYVGVIFVIIFMIVYYKGMGVVTAVCLGINGLVLIALLTTLGATLTLPGIAGIALTIGVAVDANVLINERIRDELRMGASFKNALQEGFRRAMSAILDSNITTAATAVILLYFGTGPVRGFAVTLLVGIATTMFANVFIYRVIVDTLMRRFGVQRISV